MRRNARAKYYTRVLVSMYNICINFSCARVRRAQIEDDYVYLAFRWILEICRCKLNPFPEEASVRSTYASEENVLALRSSTLKFEKCRVMLFDEHERTTRFGLRRVDISIIKRMIRYIKGSDTQTDEIKLVIKLNSFNSARIYGNGKEIAFSRISVFFSSFFGTCLK